MSRSTRPRVYVDAKGAPKGIEKEKGIIPIQPFETPYSWVIDVELDDDNDRARARAVRRRDHASWTSGSAG